MVFNQIHTEVSPLPLVKQENKKKKKEDSPAWCPEIWELWAGCLSKKEKHSVSDCDMNSPLNGWDIYLSYKKIISFLHCWFHRLLLLS